MNSSHVIANIALIPEYFLAFHAVIIPYLNSHFQNQAIDVKVDLKPTTESKV